MMPTLKIRPKLRSLRAWAVPGLVSLALFLPVPVLAANLQSKLNGEYGGSWAVLLVGTSSDCDTGYTNNKVLGTRVLTAAPYRLPVGELGRIAKVDVKRSRIDVLVDIDEPLLISRTEGPFELFDQAGCRVELEIEVPREWVKKKSLEPIEALLASLFESHDDQEAATRSEQWNRREVEPLPEGYDEVYEEYTVWKAARLKEDLLARLDKALRDAQRVIDRADDDPAYGAGFSAGMERESGRYRSWDDCSELADESFYPGSRDAPGEFEGSDEREWEKAYKDGQVVAFNVDLARRIGDCLRDF